MACHMRILDAAHPLQQIIYNRMLKVRKSFQIQKIENGGVEVSSSMLDLFSALGREGHLYWYPRRREGYHLPLRIFNSSYLYREGNHDLMDTNLFPTR